MNAMKELERLCYTDNLSLTALREKISQFSPGYVTQERYNNRPFLHAICMNKNVTIEMVELILDSFPDVASWQSDSFNWAEFYGYTHFNDENRISYPLHLACYNQYCSFAIIKLIMDKYPAALRYFTSTGNLFNYGDGEWAEGSPLHYYLARESNVDMDTVKMFAETYPEALAQATIERPFLPLHMILTNSNINNLVNTREVVAYILEATPSSIRLLDGKGRLPFHLACNNENMTLEIIQLLYNKYPEAIRSRVPNGNLPIHFLCSNQGLHADEESNVTGPLKILRFMLDIDPALATETTGGIANANTGQVWGVSLPIHIAVRYKSFAFCKELIDAYPESLRVERDSFLPIHVLCNTGTRVDSADTLRYMLELYPESINARNNVGCMPIHVATVSNGKERLVEILLEHDPDAACKEQAHLSRLPMHLTRDLEVIKVLFNAYPQAIWVRDEVGNRPMEIGRPTRPVFEFISAQFEYIHNTTVASLPLQLHRALKDNACLGTIKLLVKAPGEIQTTDEKLAYPLHTACEFSTAKVVQYLIESISTDDLDTNKDSILHSACRSGNLEVIKYLLDDHISLVSSAEVNEKGELPIHLLCEAGKDKVDSDDSTEYTEVIWRMLLANPEAVVGA